MIFNRADYYEILQVSHNASLEIIKAACIRLNEIYDPDTCGDGANIQLINQAYETLGSYEKRRTYDEWLNQQTNPEAPQHDNTYRNYSKSIFVFEAEGHQKRPWVRYGSKTLDLLWWFSLFGLIAYGFGFYTTDTESIFVILAFLLWAFLEALFISKWGATPGKWIFNMRLFNVDGNKLSYWDAFLRGLRSLGEGYAFSIPFISILTCLRSYDIYQKNGITPWDKCYGVKVVHRSIGFCRTCVIVILISSILIFAILGSL